MAMHMPVRKRAYTHTYLAAGAVLCGQMVFANGSSGLLKNLTCGLFGGRVQDACLAFESGTLP